MIAFDLIRHRYLEYKRNPQFYTNTFAKVSMYIAGILLSGYMLLVGIILPNMFEEVYPAFEPYHILGKWIFLILAIDVLLRFTHQKSPSSNLKPYYLLPVGRLQILNLLLLGSVASLYNASWLLFIVPFASIAIVPFYGTAGALGYVLALSALFLVNNLLYILFRLLMNMKFYSILLPVVFYGGIIALLFVNDGRALESLLFGFGDLMATSPWLCLAGFLLVLALLWWLACVVMLRTSHAELSSSSAKAERRSRVTDYSFLERFGNAGEYMKLEVKKIIRNKNCRIQFFLGCAAILIFVILLFIGAYSSTYMQSFVMVYIFSILGIMQLSMAMSYEGNYVDCLLVREVSILTLLKAKYYIQCLLALLPILFVIPLIVEGQQTLWGCLALYLFTCGVIFPLIFQLAVYTKTTSSLNETMNMKSSNTTGIATVITFVALFVPTLLLTILSSLLEPVVVYATVGSLGALGILTSGYWIGNIYSRFNKRKHVNLEGFRATR